ncbi:MAG: DUF4335 domain-containing protein [Cyanophyceae cyanobacterium]
MNQPSDRKDPEPTKPADQPCKPLSSTPTLPMSAITQDYQQATVTFEVSGVAAKSSSLGAGSGSPVAQIQRNLVCHLTFQAGEKPITIRGDQDLLKDLVAVMRRYLSFHLSAQPQGTFSGTVAIRPLDFIFHRLTVRQGDGIAQIDLSMTQIYDLVEGLEDIADDMPQLNTLKSAPKRSATGSPWGVGIAALVVGGVGVAAALTVLGGIESRRSNEEEFLPPTTAVQRSVAESSSADTAGVDNAEPESALSQSPQVAELDPADPDPVGTSEIAALPAPQAESIVELSEAGRVLLETLRQEWEAPEDFTIPLSYVVTVNGEGSLLAVSPVDELSEQGQAETPLATVTGRELEATLIEAEVFNVIFTQEQVSVSPQQPEAE